MEEKNKPALLCRAAVIGVIVLLAAAALAMPLVAGWYADLRLLKSSAIRALVVAFYLSVVAAMAALVIMLKLLGNIIEGRVFIEENVRFIRWIKSCCGMVALICLAAAWFYAPLIFVSIVMGFLCLVISVVRSVMAAAVRLKEENELTI